MHSFWCNLTNISFLDSSSSVCERAFLKDSSILISIIDESMVASCLFDLKATMFLMFEITLSWTSLLIWPRYCIDM